MVINFNGFYLFIVPKCLFHRIFQDPQTLAVSNRTNTLVQLTLSDENSGSEIDSDDSCVPKKGSLEESDHERSSEIDEDEPSNRKLPPEEADELYGKKKCFSKTTYSYFQRSNSKEYYQLNE